MSLKLAMALKLRRNAEEHVAKILCHDYPVDAAIQWTIGGRSFAGVVVMHCYGDRIKVRNHATGRERFIHAVDVLP